MTIRLLLADDQALVRGALSALLSLESDLEVVAEVGTGDAVVPAVLEHHPDVALLDVEMPGLDGISATAEVRLTATSAEVRDDGPATHSPTGQGSGLAGLRERATDVGATVVTRELSPGFSLSVVRS